jgi:hypothetical protein
MGLTSSKNYPTIFHKITNNIYFTHQNGRGNYYSTAEASVQRYGVIRMKPWLGLIKVIVFGVNRWVLQWAAFIRPTAGCPRSRSLGCPLSFPCCPLLSLAAPFVPVSVAQLIGLNGAKLSKRSVGDVVSTCDFISPLPLQDRA